LSASKKLLKDLPTEEEMFDKINNLKKQPHQTAVILGGAYLDHALEVLLVNKMRPLKVEDRNRLFSSRVNGYLSGTDVKIRLAYNLWLFGPYTYHDLMLINSIRNVFAHSMHEIDINNALVAEDCMNLKLLHVIPRLKLLPVPRSSDDPFTHLVNTIWVLWLDLAHSRHAIERNRKHESWRENRDYELVTLP